MTLNDIQKAYEESKSYPALAATLAEMGIKNYTVDIATGAIIYRLADGNNIVHQHEQTLRNVAAAFNKEATVQALVATQQGKTNYAQFLEAIAAAGIRFYEATLEGSNKRVTYYGQNSFYEEKIPVNKPSLIK